MSDGPGRGKLRSEAYELPLAKIILVDLVITWLDHRQRMVDIIQGRLIVSEQPVGRRSPEIDRSICFAESDHLISQVQQQITLMWHGVSGPDAGEADLPCSRVDIAKPQNFLENFGRARLSRAEFGECAEALHQRIRGVGRVLVVTDECQQAFKIKVEPQTLTANVQMDQANGASIGAVIAEGGDGLPKPARDPGQLCCNRAKLGGGEIEAGGGPGKLLDPQSLPGGVGDDQFF